ncbi:hypothetical protein [Maridesulfovibrio sp.]|uniref:hypothetical protein n=1 Tax=Maridesulfovibrio sp. TaxID=2795000 RepID=UPI002AA6F0AA|nr:hypothetical protein [Maridesulfovibrio sp.]
MKEQLIEALRGVYKNQYTNKQYAAYAQYIEDNPEYIEDGGNMMDFVEGGMHG